MNIDNYIVDKENLELEVKRLNNQIKNLVLSLEKLKQENEKLSQLLKNKVNSNDKYNLLEGSR